MSQNACPYLCGGTFFTLLLQFKPLELSAREHIEGKEGKFSDPKILIGLGKVCEESYPEPSQAEKLSSKTKTSKYKNCAEKGAKRFPLLTPTYVENFDKRIKNVNEYYKALETMHDFTKTFVNTASEEMYNQLAGLLLYLIELDTSINDNDKFYICPSGNPIKRSELHKFYDGLSVVCLPALLLGILHFIIVNENDNKINNAFGRATIKEWGSNPIKILGREKPKRDIKVVIDIPLIPNNGVSVPKTPFEQMRDIFVSLTDEFKVMDIINRKPAIMYRDDSSYLNIFLRHIDNKLGCYKETCGNTTMYGNIKTFHEELELQALSIEASLNQRYDYEDESASINMEAEYYLAESKDKPNQIKIPQASVALISAVVLSDDDHSDMLEDDDLSDILEEDDIVEFDKRSLRGLYKFAVREWGSFRNDMNLLYKIICEAIPD